MNAIQTTKQWVLHNKKKTIGLVLVAVLILTGFYFTFFHNRLSTTSFRVRQSNMDEEDFYDYADTHGSELSFSLLSPDLLTEDVQEALLGQRDALNEGIYTWVDDEYDETHVVLVSENDDLVSGIYGVYKEGDDVLIGWSSENWQINGDVRTHIVHLVIDAVLDESDNQFHIVDVNAEDDVSDLVSIPTGGDALSKEEEAAIEAQMKRDEAYADKMTVYLSDKLGVTFEEWQGLPIDEQSDKAKEAGFDSLSDLNDYLANNVAPEYNISIDDELDTLYRRYFGLSMNEMAELDGEEYRNVIDASDISQEEFEDMIYELIESRDEGL